MPIAAEPRLVQQMEGAPWEIEGYLKVGGYEAWKRCVKELKATQVIDELKKSGLRGRGGAGFPTGIKWDKVLNHRVPERYFVCNAGEHEPGTFQARERGFIGKNVLGSGIDIELEIFDGHGSYVAGEETAMLESMQGRPAMPRQKPPFYPTDFGLYGKPTLVNNVETLCNIPRILHKGSSWFTQVGTEKCPGTMMFSLSGAVNRPGVYEMPMGVTIREVIEQCGGGVPNGRKIKAVFPGGPAFPMVTADQLDLTMDFDSLKKAGTGLGSAGMIVVDDATCMVAKTLHFSNFFKNESCGQCPPCRMGTMNLAALMTKIEEGNGTQKDLDSMLQLCGFVKGTGYCTLVTGASVLVQSSLKLFRHEYEEHIRLQRCPSQEAQAGMVAHS